MTDTCLFVGIDGWDLTISDYIGHPFWEGIRDDVLIVEIPKPGEMEGGRIATASSPRLWGRIYTGCEPDTNGILGFWEKKLPDGDKVKVEVDKEWVMETRCEKAVKYDDFLVSPLWDIVAEAGHGIGSSGTWFTYPLPDHLKAHVDEHGGWFLTDAMFPYDSELMDPDRIYHPDAAWPGNIDPDWDYLEEVGAGMRTPELAKEDPWGFYQDLIQADQDRYRHVREMLDRFGEQPLTMTLTRGVDACAHKFRRQEDIAPHYPGELHDGVENMRRVTAANFDAVQELWESYDFDHLVLGGDHGCGSRINDDGELELVGDDHEWPANFAVLSPDVEGGQKIRAKYEDITPTILELLGIMPPDHIEGASVIGQAKVTSRLNDLGYLP